MNGDVLVLTRDHLQRLYGPSLATLPQFMADDDDEVPSCLPRVTNH
jgi:hypothetical protein